ncbi:ankyrin repeat-containing protein BDA1-like isoform X2 [Cornus florida]|uniref:ankyrin repeat-containing protein BDA1-like isoform X2 n=1 Tax=Cornus florida TaxID=4283 RepID=UPI00289842B6|nr:ankyrin repeat-containing protein BDA1-like isoform X2 [Cornus florida]
MDERLKKAAKEGCTKRLHNLIIEYQGILERNIDGELFADTPLHVAASTGDLRFAAEVMRLKPSYARAFNRDGLSPIHVALLNGHDGIVDWFVSVDSTLVRQRRGDDDMTCLHYVIAQGNENLLRLFLLDCPSSIQDSTAKQETVLHVALKHNHLRIFEALVGYLQKIQYEDILNRPDENGDTVLHMAARNNQTEAVKLLLSKKLISKMEINRENKMGLTALDIASMESSNREIEEMIRRGGEKKSLSEMFIYNNPVLAEMKFLLARDDVQRLLHLVEMTAAAFIATSALEPVFRRSGRLRQINTLGSFAFYLSKSFLFYWSMTTIRRHFKANLLVKILQLFIHANYCRYVIFHLSTLSFNSGSLFYEALTAVTELLFFICTLQAVFGFLEPLVPSWGHRI